MINPLCLLDGHRTRTVNHIGYYSETFCTRPGCSYYAGPSKETKQAIVDAVEDEARQDLWRRLTARGIDTSWLSR